MIRRGPSRARKHSTSLRPSARLRWIRSSRSPTRSWAPRGRSRCGRRIPLLSQREAQTSADMTTGPPRSPAGSQTSRTSASSVRRSSTSPRFWAAWGSISSGPYAGCQPGSECGSGFRSWSLRWRSSSHRPVGSRRLAHRFPVQADDRNRAVWSYRFSRNPIYLAFSVLVLRDRLLAQQHLVARHARRSREPHELPRDSAGGALPRAPVRCRVSGIQSEGAPLALAAAEPLARLSAPGGGGSGRRSGSRDPGSAPGQAGRVGAARRRRRARRGSAAPSDAMMP